MKQDKGSGIVIMNTSKYHDKCLKLFNTDQFTKLNHDPTKKIKAKYRGVWEKVKQT